MAEAMASRYPRVHNPGRAILRGGRLTFSYVDTRNQPKTDTKPVLKPQVIVGMVQRRIARFKSAPYGARESDSSRSERKYIAAHDTHNQDILRQAWELMNREQRMEFEMMLSPTSHEGISNPAEIADSEPTQGPVGDDGKPLDAEPRPAPSERFERLRRG